MKRLILGLAAMLLAAPAFAAGTLADATAFDRGAGRALPVHWGDGQAFVAGAPGNEYAIRIRNRSSTDLLAVVSVDGVNAVSGQTASPAQGGYVIPARGYLEIKGVAQESGSGLLRSTSPTWAILCRAHRAPGQRWRDRRRAVQAQAGARHIL